MLNNGISCPWWQSDYPGIFGLKKYVECNNSIYSNSTSAGEQKERILPGSNKQRCDFTKEEIDLSFWPLTDEDIITVTMSKSCNVVRLNLRGCVHLTDRGILNLAETWKWNGAFNHNLISLNLSKCGELSDKSIQAIKTYFNRIKHIDISDCIKITDVGVCNLMHGCKYLEELHLRNLPRIHDKSLLCIRQNLVLMKSLRVIGML